MVKGGAHPRGKSPGIGKVGRLSSSYSTAVSIAADIYYRANRDCLTDK